jgi:hypothetical protein
MLLLKIALLPVVLIAAVFLAMITHIAGLTLYHHLAWKPTTATVLHSETLCEVTHQPSDAVLRAVAARGPCEAMGDVVLPKGGTKPRTFEGVYGALAYDTDGGVRKWEGKLSDAGVYNASAGEKRVLYYDPSSPQSIDTAEYRGWFGGLLIFSLSACLVAFYIWLVWPRRKRPPDAGVRMNAPMTRGIDNRRHQTFGKA